MSCTPFRSALYIKLDEFPGARRLSSAQLIAVAGKYAMVVGRGLPSSREGMMFRFVTKPNLGIVQVDVLGAWTVDEARRYGTEAGEHFSEARAKFGRLRLLLNLQQSEIMHQEIIMPLMSSGVRNGRPEDLIAAVVPSPAMKLQIRRMFTERGVALCSNVEEAESWLTTSA